MRRRWASTVMNRTISTRGTSSPGAIQPGSETTRSDAGAPPVVSGPTGPARASTRPPATTAAQPSRPADSAVPRGLAATQARDEVDDAEDLVSVADHVPVAGLPPAEQSVTIDDERRPVGHVALLVVNAVGAD